MDPEYNLRLGDFFETYLDSHLSNHGLTKVDLRTRISWRELFTYGCEEDEMTVNHEYRKTFE